MRAFHCSWFAFFIAFFVWFAITPLIPEIQDSLGLSNEEIWTSNIANVTGTIFMRFLLGPLCDTMGPRILFTMVLAVSAIPTACIGFVNSATGLTVIRLFIGLAGGTFVMCQYWTSKMFTKEIVATANGLVGGWGNLGAGITQLLVGTALFPLFKEIFKGTENPAENAWRTVCIVPAIFALMTAILIYKVSDDTPKGNYHELKKNGAMGEPSAVQSFRKGFYNVNTWLLFIQYGCCFGVELTMNSAAAKYFHDRYRLTTDESAAIASIFGWMNLFARGLGGWLSDIMNMKCKLLQFLDCVSISSHSVTLIFLIAKYCRGHARTSLHTTSPAHSRRGSGLGLCTLRLAHRSHQHYGVLLHVCSSRRGLNIWYCSIRCSRCLRVCYWDCWCWRQRRSCCVWNGFP